MSAARGPRVRAPHTRLTPSATNPHAAARGGAAAVLDQGRWARAMPPGTLLAAGLPADFVPT